MRRLLLAVAGLGVVGWVALGAGASAQAPTGTTITVTELAEGSTFRIIDEPPRTRSQRNPRFSSGDRLIFTNPLADAGGNRVGRLHAVCTITRGGRFTTAVVVCEGGYVLRNGALHVMVVSRLSGDATNGSVVGGTGAYANARGTFTSDNSEDDNRTTITLVP